MSDTRSTAFDFVVNGIKGSQTADELMVFFDDMVRLECLGDAYMQNVFIRRTWELEERSKELGLSRDQWVMVRNKAIAGSRLKEFAEKKIAMFSSEKS